MFGLLNATQVYGLQHEQQTTATTTTAGANLLSEQKQQQLQQPHRKPKQSNCSGDYVSGSKNSCTKQPQQQQPKHHRRSTSNVTETLKEKRFFATLSSSMPQSIKSPTNFIEKFLKSELLNSYDTLKNYTSNNNNNNHNSNNTNKHHYNNNIQSTNNHFVQTGGSDSSGIGGRGQMHIEHRDGLGSSFNCLHGSYRSNCDGEFYEPVNLNTKPPTTTGATTTTTTKRGLSNNNSNIGSNNNNKSEMTIKCSKNLLVESTQPQSPATLQNYQKLPDFAHDRMIDAASGASSGEFNQQQQQHHNHHRHHQQHQQHHHHSHHHHQSSGSETNGLSSAASNLYKKLSFGSRSSKQHLDINGTSGTAMLASQSNEVASDNSCSSISTTTTHTTNTSSTSTPRAGHTNHSGSGSGSSKAIERTSSSSSSADCGSKTSKVGVLKGKERRKNAIGNEPMSEHGNGGALVMSGTPTLTPERAQRRRLMQMISNYDQQNKQLQRELAKEKRRRTEELACVVKSLLCFESKLKTDMKAVNQRMLEKDNEICRLVRQNRALRKHLAQRQHAERESTRDEGVVEDGGEEPEQAEREHDRVRNAEDGGSEKLSDTELLAIDCLVLEALQCMNCRKQFYDIDLKECWTQTKDCGGNCGGGGGGGIGGRKKDEHTNEPCCSSSDDTTVSSSFYGARRSVRYTSKRTAGTFRDYMRSRSMNIDDPALEQNSEENTSTISREDESQTTSSYEKINMYSRTIERMHGVKCDDGERERERQRQLKRRTPQIEEDDGIFSPTQDDEEDDDDDDDEHERDDLERDVAERESVRSGGNLKIVMRRSIEFSEAAPHQLYETSTDDWYASASDQEDLVLAGTAASSKSYGHGAVNPVLECVNQILLQESMDEAIHEMPPPPPPTMQPQLTPKTGAHLLQVPTTASAASHLPRRSSLSDRRTERTSNNQGSDAPNSRNGTLTRKRVHFSTKNSMVHVPRNDDDDDDDDDDDEDADDNADIDADEDVDRDGDAHLISSHSSLYYPMNYCPPSPQQVAEREHLEVLNYESIYSNEYEPIGSEHNSSNLYVDMEAATSKLSSGSTAANTGNGSRHSAATAATSSGSNAMAISNSGIAGDCRMTKMPPALPPKPANLLKFRKSLQQLDEVPEADCGQSLSGGGSEPDYCSISEVNVGMTSVQIVADVHKAPPTVHDDADDGVVDEEAEPLELEGLEVSTVASSGDEEPVVHKTDKRNIHNRQDKHRSAQKHSVQQEMVGEEDEEDEVELLADIPKLPNVAAIIVPKSPKKPPPHHQQQQQHQQQQKSHSDYLTMTPKMAPPNLKLLTPLITPTTIKKNTATPTTPSAPTGKAFETPTPLKLHLNVTPSNCAGSVPQQPYKRKHMPNILAEINKRMSQPNSPTTPTRPTSSATPTTTITTSTPPSQGNKAKPTQMGNALLKELEQAATTSPSLPLEAEFDWYNLDAEYGKVPAASTSSGGVGVGVGGTKMLAEIHEDHESIDEYNLDEEFSLASSEKEDQDHHSDEEPTPTEKRLSTVLLLQQQNNAMSFPLYCESSPLVPSVQPQSLLPTLAPPSMTMPLTTTTTTKAKKMKKNLANFEKFIEGSGLSTKPLPSRRKIYFAGPV